MNEKVKVKSSKENTSNSSNGNGSKALPAENLATKEPENEQET